MLGCGGSTSQNCSYFQSSANTLQSGQCTLKICKCSTDICQVYVFWCSSKLIRRIWEQTMKKCIRIRTNTTFYLTQFNPLWFPFQLRLDFQSFVIAGPSTLTASSGYEVGGSAATAAGKKISLATSCLTDTFSLTGPSGSVPPTICGTNTGEHSKQYINYSFWFNEGTAILFCSNVRYLRPSLPKKLFSKLGAIAVTYDKNQEQIYE